MTGSRIMTFAAVCLAAGAIWKSGALPKPVAAIAAASDPEVVPILWTVWRRG